MSASPWGAAAAGFAAGIVAAGFVAAGAAGFGLAASLAASEAGLRAADFAAGSAPPGDPFHDRVERRSMAARLRLAEHDVIGAGFPREHGVVPGGKSAATGNPCRFERRQRGRECRDAMEMRAVGAGRRNKLGMTGE